MAAASPHAPIDSPAVWHAADVADPAGWTIELSEAEREELAAAARAATEQGRSIATLTVEDAVLPSLAATVDRVVEELTDGPGFVLLRRFPVDLLDEAEIELAYAALGLLLGTPVSQDAEGTLLGHVRDERVERTGPEVRLYRTRQRQDFHTDGADVIGLLCLHPAASGGESRLASSYAVYNEILRRRPDLLEVLYEPMWWDRNGEESPGEPPAYPLPVLRDVDGVPRVFYIGWYIRDAQRHPEVPRLTTAQREALELIETVANDPAFHVEMDFRVGDVQLLNNAKILHSREAYDDAQALAERRHLLRLWLSAHDFSSVEDGLRAGIPRRSDRGDRSPS
jgi:Taurine catabolism dioxygenase TauD, TfdA family